jgi:hypothetical protein
VGLGRSIATACTQGAARATKPALRRRSAAMAARNRDGFAESLVERAAAGCDHASRITKSSRSS